MTLAQILASFINEAGYDEEIIHNEATGHVELTTGLALENQSCTLCFRGDENLHRLSLTIVLPFRVNPGKESEACMLFNFINDHYMYPGRVTADADRKIRYKEIIDTDSTKPSLDIINTMLNNGTGLLK